MLETCIEEKSLQFLKLSNFIDNGYSTWDQRGGKQKNINNGIKAYQISCLLVKLYVHVVQQYTH